jgi:hypothetical protein
MTWTDEELRAGGWAEDEVTGYRAGTASAEAWLAALESRPPAAEDPGPQPAAPPSETEARAHELAALMVSESDRLDEAKADARRAEVMSQTRVDVMRPGDPDPPAAVRSRALAHLLRDGVVMVRPGAHNRPREVAVRVADGSYRTFTAGAMPEMTVIRPETADAQLGAWEWENRRREDQILIAGFGLAECQRAGVLLTGATDAGEFEKLILPRGVEAL